MHKELETGLDDICITYDGATLTLTEWSVTTGIDKSTILERIKKGWSIENALTTHA